MPYARDGDARDADSEEERDEHAEDLHHMGEDRAHDLVCLAALTCIDVEARALSGRRARFGASCRSRHRLVVVAYAALES